MTNFLYKEKQVDCVGPRQIYKTPVLYTVLLGLILAINTTSAQTFPVSVANLPAGKQIVITYKATVNRPLEPRTALTVADQISINGQGFAPFLSNDPDTPAPNDPTRTAVLGCAIQNIAATIPVCGASNTYSVSVTVTNNGEAPLTGNLVLVANGATFPTPVTPGQASQTVVLTLPANGQPVSIRAFYSALPACELEVNNLFTAPVGCGIIGNRVWEDLNGDGIQNDGNGGVANVRVFLLNCNDMILSQTQTDGNGNYQFRQLAPGQYKLRFDLSTAAAPFNTGIFTLRNVGSSDLDSDVNPVTRETDCFTLAAGAQDLSRDAGLYVPGQIGNLTWEDRNRNNIFDSAIDTPLPGVPVELYRCNENNPIATQVTNASGQYLFTGLLPGSYRIKFGFPASGVYNRVTPKVGTNAVDSDAGPDGFTACVSVQSRTQNLDVDAGYVFCPASVSMACTNSLNLTMGASCQVTIAPEMILLPPPVCPDRFTVRIFTPTGAEIGNTVTAPYVGQVLRAIVVDQQTGNFCGSDIVVTDPIPPTIECPPNTNKAAINQDVQLFGGTLSTTDSSANLFNFNCFRPIVNPGGGNHYYETFTFTVTTDDFYTFEMSPTFGDGAALLYRGDFAQNGGFCENVIAQSYTSFSVGVFFNNISPILRITQRLRAGQTYTLFTTTRAPGVTGSYFWAAYSDGAGAINGLSAIPTVAQYDLICTDANVLLNKPESLNFVGTPNAMDNCSRPVTNITFTDQLSESGDCGGAIITRRFTARDASNNAAECTQLISIRKPTLADVILPSLSFYAECSESFTVDVNGNPHPSLTGYPFVKTAFANHNLAPLYCNISANYQDNPRIVNCGPAYTFIRNWTVIDFCNPVALLTFQQLIQIGDSQEPTVECPIADYDNDGVPDLLRFSTTTFDCTATFDVPAPRITDNCSSSTFSAQVLNDTIVEVRNIFGIVIGTEVQTRTLATVQSNASLRVTGIPLGNHRFRYTVTDACGNRTVLECPFEVIDDIEPVMVCKSSLTVSLGGEGLARVFASDINEGSRDNCAIDQILIRRRYTRNPITCEPVTPYFSEWGTFVEINCCDADSIVFVQLRVIDKSGNDNECPAEVNVLERIRPFCVAPPSITLPCTTLPAMFNPNDTLQLQALFGVASANDNCPGAQWQELAPTVNLQNCRTGTITRRFRAVDRAGNLSANTCQQVITLTPVNNYEIKFPKDANEVCGTPNADTLQVRSLACEQLSVSVTEERFSSVGSECYRLFRTYRVVNFCEYDGSSLPIVIGRDEDCDNNPGDEDVWVLRRPNNTFIDRTNSESDNQPVAGARGCSPTNPVGYWRTTNSVGFWQYTQVIRVFDTTASEVFFVSPTPFCSNDNTTCQAAVNVPFVVNEACTPGTVNLQIAVDRNNNGTIDGSLAMQGGTLSGTYPNFQISGNFPIGKHAFQITAQDGCGNTSVTRIPFEIVDCRPPALSCTNSRIFDLLSQRPPIDRNGDGVPDRGYIVIRARDFVNGNPTDCSGAIRYSINRVGQPANIAQDSLVLTCDQLGEITLVEIYAWDNAANPYAVQPNGTVGGPNYSLCQASVFVVDNSFNACVPPNEGLVSGIIRTEVGKPVEAVRVFLSGQSAANMFSLTDGSYRFDTLAEGHDYTIAPLLDDNHINGVSTLDLIIITKHILGVEPLDSPYKIIAADVNNSKTVSTLDLIQMRKLILGVDVRFPSNTSWRFVRASYVFPVPSNPWVEEFPEVININDLSGKISNANFIAIKIGDVNLSAIVGNAIETAPRSAGLPFVLETTDREVLAGERFTLPIRADMTAIEGYQMTLAFQSDALEFSGIDYGLAGPDNFGLFATRQGFLTLSWHDVTTRQVGIQELFGVHFRAKVAGRVSRWLGVSSRYTPAEAYDKQDGLRHVALHFHTNQAISTEFELYQNAPNPFDQHTTIGFYLPWAAPAILTVTDVHGRLVHRIAADYAPGYHQILLDRSELPATGVLYYTLETAGYNATRKMIRLQ